LFNDVQRCIESGWRISTSEGCRGAGRGAHEDRRIKAKAYKVKHITKNPKVALHFNTDETGEEHVIVFVGDATIDVQCPPAHKVPTYFKKYQSGLADLNMTPEEFSREYSTAIRRV
jgi:PPOX class probable F420-dependent enzyme